MARPADFERATLLAPPKGHEDDCSTLPVMHVEGSFFSFWRFDDAELEYIKEHGGCWLKIVGTVHPMVAVFADHAIKIDGRPVQIEPDLRVKDKT
jgi:hypothetical protein